MRCESIGPSNLSKRGRPAVNRRGMGLIQVLIVAGLLGFLGLAIASMLTSSLRGQRAIEVRDAVRLFETEILVHLANQAACTASLRNLNPKVPGTAVSLLKRADDSAYVTVGDLVQNRMLKLSQMILSTFTPDHVSAPLQGKSKLFLTLEPLGDPVGPKSFSREIILATTINSGDQLTSCSAISSSGSQFWLASPLVTNGIYTGVDAVGIGTTSPSARLDVAGEVKFGSSGVACTAAREGQVRYNSVIKSIEFCNGSNWTKAGSGLRVESGSNEVPNSCTAGSYVAYESAFFCTAGAPAKTITFSRPFASPPRVIVSLAGASADSSLLPCTAGAMDQVGLSYDSVSTTGFRALAWMSPFGANCDPYANYVGPIRFSWLAVGE